MKKTLSILLALIMLLSTASCGLLDGGEEEETWETQYEMGMRYLQEGRYEEAILAFEAAIQLDPKQADSYLALSEAYRVSDQLDKAAETLSKGVEAAKEPEKLQTRLTEIEKFIEKNPTSGAGSGSSGSGAESGTGKPSEAAQAIIDVLELVQGKSAVVHSDCPSFPEVSFEEFDTALSWPEGAKLTRGGRETGGVSFEDTELSYDLEVESCAYFRGMAPEEGKIYAAVMAEKNSKKTVAMRFTNGSGTGKGVSIGIRDVLMGDTLAEVAEKLGLSLETLEKYRGAILMLASDERSSNAGRLGKEPLRDDTDAPRTLDILFLKSMTEPLDDKLEYAVLMDFDGQNILVQATILRLELLMEMMDKTE